MHQIWTDYLSSNTKTLSKTIEAGTTNNVVFLPTLGVLQLHGDQAAEFLQGYLSCDTTKLGPEQALFGAMCDIKGRVIASFYLLEIQGITSFVMRTDIFESVKRHLDKYLVFSKCTLQDASDNFVVLGRIGTVHEEPHSKYLLLTAAHGMSKVKVGAQQQLLICTPEQAIKLCSAAEVHLADTLWQLADLNAGLIMLEPEIAGLHLPQSLNMTAANKAVDFNKGCYLGQEIIARVEHRGKLKRGLAIFSWKNSVNGKPEIGDSITSSSGKTIGQVAKSVESMPGNGLLAGVVRRPDSGAITEELCAGQAKLSFVQYGENSD